MFLMKVMMMMIMIMLVLMVTMSSKHVVAQTGGGGCDTCNSQGAACGDPHLVGFDGSLFDIWDAGDYLVLRESDGFEVWFTVSYRWPWSAKNKGPFITEIRCRGPGGGPWMKVSASRAAQGSNHTTTKGTKSVKQKSLLMGWVL